VGKNGFAHLVSADDRRMAGKARRADAPRSGHAAWSPPANRPDPISILEEQGRKRISELLPIRYGRMAESPFGFLRGAPAVMASDLQLTSTCGIRVQACGDAHLLNFGVWATPERHLVFEVNDFDETLPAPFDWDVKRLAVSVFVAGRGNGFRDAECATATQSAVATYRAKMAALASTDHLDQWYDRIDVDDVLGVVQAGERRQAERAIRKARARTHLGTLDKITEVVDGRRRFIENPPLIQRIEHADWVFHTKAAYLEYVRSLPEDRRVLLQRYRFVDTARKVVGVGSVGTDTRVVLLLGDDDSDPLFLQLKEAERSVLEPYTARSAYRHQGRRVVCGQRLMQAASDIFLGWMRSHGRHYYVRQLRDMKGSAEIERLDCEALAHYAALCGAELARAHARGGDADAIYGYLGRGDSFDRAVTKFAAAYADQTEQDHASLVSAVKSGRLEALADA
jgi:uncharacterized protein (DUF2252 family)